MRGDYLQGVPAARVPGLRGLAKHLVQRQCTESDYGRECMIRCWPRFLSRHLPASTRMVSTRSVTGKQRRNESLLHIAQRLRELPQVEHEPVSSKKAAVLVPLYEDEDGVVKVWLTQRALHLNSHQGEVALPGGKRDPTDADDAFTAKREAFEELGLQPDSVEVLCTVAPFLSKHLYSVTPVVAQVPNDFTPSPSVDEVSAVFSMPLSYFLDTHRHIHWDVKSKTTPRKCYRVHSFDYQGFIVWGLTAQILIHVAQLALGRPAAFEVDHPSNTTSSRNASRM
eukprot:GHUV01003623.1.p1 GENE.GHUV01003623.1~~GHUV01003623.1.p1  ORF type:complete len:282 (+),score=55.25 GHUV01003623.1:287-1132(+)